MIQNEKRFLLMPMFILLHDNDFVDVMNQNIDQKLLKKILKIQQALEYTEKSKTFLL